jgi:hypothetical protein
MVRDLCFGISRFEALVDARSRRLIESVFVLMIMRTFRLSFARSKPTFVLA